MMSRTVLTAPSCSPRRWLPSSLSWVRFRRTRSTASRTPTAWRLGERDGGRECKEKISKEKPSREHVGLRHTSWIKRFAQFPQTHTPAAVWSNPNTGHNCIYMTTRPQTQPVDHWHHPWYNSQLSHQLLTSSQMMSSWWSSDRDSASWWGEKPASINKEDYWCIYTY